MTKTNVRVVIWSAGECVLAWYGTHGIGWCWNLFRFLAVLMVILATIIVVATATDRDKERLGKFYRALSRANGWAAQILDVLTVGLLAATGHYVFAALWFYQLALAVVMDGKAQEFLERERVAAR